MSRTSYVHPPAMIIQNNVDLTPYTTFGFKQTAAYCVEVRNDSELYSAVQQAQKNDWPILVVGSGSNLIFTRDYPGLIIKQTEQYTHVKPLTDEPGVLVTASAGVSWHSLVLDTVKRNINGLENLSLIPGLVGAAPVQNIGAYGVELSDRFHSLRALHVPTLQWVTLTKDECEFSYRDSLFKRLDGQYIITEVTLLLGNHLPTRTHYEPLADYLEKHHKDCTPTAQMISDAVCAVRSSKLPDPQVLPNAGSFFHNPVVPADQYLKLKERFPDIVGYKQADDQFKLAAGWLIDRLGYKGLRQNGVGVHDKQALVLIKYHQTESHHLIQLVQRIQAHVADEFGVRLSVEPRIF